MDKTGTLPPKEEAVLEKKADGESVEVFDASSLIIIPVNDDSKKIRQIFSNETSMKILEVLKQESMSLSELAERLDIPLTTVKYNLDILVENDLVNIKRIKYSEKGRQVKIYEAPEKVIVFAPKKMSRFSLVAMLQKYAVALTSVGLLGIIFNALYSRYVLMRAISTTEGTLFSNTSASLSDSISESVLVLVPDSIPAPVPDPVPAPVPDLVPAPVPDPVPALPAQIPDVDLGAGAGIAIEGNNLVREISTSFSDWFFSILAHYSVWFVMGAIFACALIWVIEYISVKREN
jgi:DNA-binding transcriptional ArsR family regulator